MRTLLILIGLSLHALAVSPDSSSVKLAWDASPTSGITNYVVYYGIGPAVLGWNGTNILCGCYSASQSAGTNLTLTLAGLARGQTYYFAATAWLDGVESGYSNEVRFIVTTKPGGPKNLTVQQP